MEVTIQKPNRVKGVIVAAGYGSRFLPVTKTVPKEMLPLIDRPAIDLVVAEMLDAGIREILIITSRRKKVLEDYFDREVELETVFDKEGKSARLRKISVPDANFFFVRQREMRGTGHALLQARPFVGEDPFVVAYPDDIFLGASVSEQLVSAYRKTHKSVLTVGDLGAEADVSRYGVVAPKGEGNPCPVARLVEKPPLGEEPSKLVSYGRYLFTPDIFPLLEAGWAGHGEGEFYHIDALNQLAEKDRVVALAVENERLDTGEPLGYLEAVCRYALEREDLAGGAKALFQRLSGS